LKDRMGMGGVWSQRRVRRGVVCGESCERVRRGVCVQRQADGPGVWRVCGV
jgi:hypothetical protein